ncbi:MULTISPECIES: XisI protein [unclassified Spirulina]|uniref:XisI protein n=1 Tax=unclassified Spirulina TaxID=2684457 RepID=UPI0019515B41|nr:MULTISPECIES: XisI protein [Spirulina]MEA5470160.1 XisI protein [Spirulina sp. 06S082]
MDRLKQYRNAIQQVLNEHAQLSRKVREDRPSDRDIPAEAIAICDPQTDNYLLVTLGWNEYQRIHSIIVHLRIIDGKIHVEWNGTEDIAEDLMEQGIPESAFVPAFRHPNFRDAIATKT